MAEKSKEYMPRLRFPEFPNQAGWERMPLGSICHLKPGKFIEADKIYPCWREGLVPCYGGNGLRGYVESANYKVCYPLIGRQGALCGNIQMPETEFYATEHAIVAESNKNINRKFLFYLLSKLNINKLATGQAQPGISVDIVKKIPVLLPSPGEQQKIADCLSSLDELIEAHEQKRDALVEHKKGLMQRLFPAEGETSPRWRFSGFSSPWSIVPLDAVSSISSGLTTPQVDYITSYKVSRIETISSGSINMEKVGYIEYTNNIEQFKLDNGDILFSNINSIDHIGKSAYFNSNNLLYHGMNLLRIKASNGNFPKFLFYFINTDICRESFRRRANKAVNQASINQTELGKTLIKIPSYEEQQKIADCLSSLDARIEAEEAKIASLREHKRGLMQRLFPQSL